MATNIRDVAKAAGVSVATVSKVLNGYTTVSQKTKERVLRIVKETRFQPNAAARALVGRRSMTLGIYLTTGLTHPFFASILSGMELALKAKGYDLIYLSQLTFNKDYSFVRHCQSRNVEGVVIFGFQEDDAYFKELLESGLPSIFIDMDIVGQRAGYISSDNVDAMCHSISYLRELKHRRIAFIAGIVESYVGRLRYDGYKKGLEIAGLPFREDYVAHSIFTRESGYSAMNSLLELPPAERPTAVVCCSDMCAIGAIDAIRDAGLSVPGDISVIGFDDIELARNVTPALTTIRQDMIAMGRKAVELLDELIVDEMFASPTAIVPTELIVRDTCAPAKEE
ncbi:LacI family DNA-binding transcriptional regulator [Cohnella faecalis]|uniref:LacI family transcriptional regulator n=1 Tax=Cohnella faecalis TaxID=2315694 RepID=A0A398CQR4_9BACL|nr:LacI family DNA-binding transcriptional regulator [Cohnella faecalis]RIE01274.1 LacI family transcriptional regulator [Cohnella faecalis]